MTDLCILDNRDLRHCSSKYPHRIYGIMAEEILLDNRSSASFDFIPDIAALGETPSEHQHQHRLRRFVHESFDNVKAGMLMSNPTLVTPSSYTQLLYSIHPVNFPSFETHKRTTPNRLPLTPTGSLRYPSVRMVV